MEQHDSLKQLFQQEFGKMVAVISKIFGLRHIEIAEDLVSETFLLASETWGLKGVPENPTAWLYAVAKQKTLYHFRRSKIYEEKIAPMWSSQQETVQSDVDVIFSSENVKDSQLRMIFAICNPAIASEAQIGLALRILCGFGIDEIAEAFITNKETINKRLFRAKEKLREENIDMDLPPPDEIPGRLNNVQHIIYLLFSEGYYSKTKNDILQKDLCLEAMRLALLLTQYEITNTPRTNALLALMCFHASRFEARKGDDNAIVLYEKQDENLWDQELIKQGRYFLALSAVGNEISSYHLEARIASWHCIKEDTTAKWEDILQNYDQLQRINYSPVVALNRIFALYKVKGAAVALAEAEKLNMDNDHFYFLLLAELYKGIDAQRARYNFEKASSLAKTETERQVIQQRIAELP